MLVKLKCYSGCLCGSLKCPKALFWVLFWYRKRGVKTEPERRGPLRQATLCYMLPGS